MLATTEFQDWVHAAQNHMESVLAQFLPASDIVPQRLHAAMRYAVLGGGKRVRPLLVFAAGELAGAAKPALDIAAAAVELIHVYSLVHDDLPCMDDDVLRRGKPTVHVEFDEATALLVGDGLQSLAFQLLADKAFVDPQKQLSMVQHLALAAGSRGMAGGQALDLAAVGQTLSLPELELMHIHKTGALIRVAVLMGTLCGKLSAAHTAHLDHFAKCIGLAYQVVDDVLDAEASTATLGKTAGKDAEQNKPTYVSVLGLAEAKSLAQTLREDAVTALENLGPAAGRLRALADLIVLREF